MLVNINRIKVNVKEAAAWYNLQVPQSNFQLAFVFGSLHYQISSQMTTLQKLDLNSEGSQIMSTLTTTRMHHKAGAHLIRAGAPTVAFNPKPQSLVLPTETCTREEAASKQWQLDKRAPLSSPEQ